MLGPHWSSFEIRRTTRVDGSDLIIETPNATDVQADRTDTSTPAKKKFVTPEISVPVDVLEATTFFQLATSGGSN
jgi:hypothetical protein